MAQTLNNFDKAAVLLSRLDPQALDKVLEILGPDFAGKLRPALTAVTRRKDFGALTDQVLQEFRELQQEVRATVSGAPALQKLQGALQQQTTRQDNAEGVIPNAAPTDRPATEVTGSEMNSLASVAPPILAAALKPESPRMIATVLKQLPTEVSGKVLEALATEQRQSVFLLMADTVQVNPVIVSRVQQRLLDVCRTINPEAVEQQDKRVTTLIGILQTVEREERIRLLESLTERDPDLAAQVDNLMYDYADVLRIEDRSVQKLLGQLEQKIVAMALKTAPEELRQKVFKNLSERVRMALTEEMELLSGVTASKADQARREIANVIRSMDKEGALLWIEE